ncbi:hypothetical protein L6164_018149 [Bauhinia variegata]|uniref:Uncharacterized protein n=1 Tax=Bauhinia variegata TaxID=167791 RepID=A0ACB9NAT4_BAUVA|nr:hypothetical protein L6164_018149 [Bauhinia variegata]
MIMKPTEFLLGRAIPSHDVASMIIRCPQLLVELPGATKQGIRCLLDWMLNCSEQRLEERLQGNDIESDEEEESDDEVLCRRIVSL